MATAEKHVFGDTETVSFNTVKEAYDNPIIRASLLTMFKEQINAVENENYRGIDLAREDLADTIYNYPKVIFEDTIKLERGVIASAFREVGQVRLPFPKMTVIASSDYSNNKITAITPWYLVQDQDSVIAYFVTNRLDSTVVDACAFRYYLGGGEYGGEGSNQILTEIMLTPEHMKIVGKERAHTIAGLLMHVVTRVIYMMTISGGDFYISTPNPKEATSNAKRVRNNKKPLIEFRMITIDGKKPDTLKSPPQGTHASPRLHWRRGHYRTISSGKKVWIDPMLVGDEKNGKIIKDYAVGNYEEKRNVAVL